MKKSHWAFLILFLGSTTLNAQQYYQFSAFPGFLIPHRNYIPHMAAHTFGIEAAFRFTGTGNLQRDSLLRGLDWGIAFYANSLGNKELSGNVYAINPFFQSKLGSIKNSHIYLRIGTGVGYFTRIFDPLTNTANRAMSNRLNGMMQFMFLHHVPIHNNWEVQYGLGMSHFSNGNYARPNLGINTPQFNLGFSRASGKQRNTRSEVLLTQSYWEFRLGHGVKKASVADPTQLSVQTLGITRGIGASPIRYWRLGADMFYDRMNPYVVFEPSTLTGYAFKEAFEMGLRGGFEYNFGSILVFFDMGFYLYKPDGVGKLPYYSCVGIHYSLREWGIGPRLKTHAANADYIDWGVFYRKMKVKKRN